MSKLKKEWDKLFSSQQLDGCLLDYALVEKHKLMLDQLALVGNNAAFIFDLYKQQYIYASQNFNEIIDVDLKMLVSENGQQITDNILHPEDNCLFEQMQLDLYRFLFSLPSSQKMSYKHIYSFRVLNSDKKYIRFVSQQQVLELDSLGNIWLVLGIIDLAPDQIPDQGFECSIINYKTGKRLSISDFTNIDVKLTNREKEILGLIKNGLLSKEISDKLSISINTVNIHRQNILQKTNTTNSIEAIQFVEKMGLL